jgi:predicted MFS family arabinose efflux permease
VAARLTLLSQLFESSPLRNRPFRLFYLGSIGAAVGYTMQATVAAWLMATLTPSALMVALVQTASTAPALILGLLAGTLADLIDRRRIIFATQIALILASALMGLAAIAGWIGPSTLLLITFLVGAGFTLYLPAQQAAVNEFVTRAELPRAVALGAVAFNLARAIGPALAGAIAAWTSTGSALLASALFFLPMLFALRYWKKKRELPLPGVPETLLSGIQSGLRFARHSAAMRALILRNLAFAACASAFWALLPVIARDQLHLGAGGYGLLSAGFGVGAVLGAVSMPRQLQRLSLDAVVTTGILLWAAAATLIAATGNAALALLGACCAGMAWVTVFASLSAGAQSTAPAWVRARALATNLVAVQASLALGSVLWGALASWTDTRVAMAASAALLILLQLVYRNVKVTMGSEDDVTPSLHLPDMTVAVEPLPDDGPVMIQIEYSVESEDQPRFLRAIQKVGPTRRRNGAASWRVYRDVGDSRHFIERYVIASWSEYTRLRTRMTVADRDLQERVTRLQRPETPIRVSRLIGVKSEELQADDFADTREP